MQFIKKVLFFFLGTFTWQLPPWLKGIGQLLHKASSWGRKNKNIVWLTVLFTAMGYGAMLWYDSLPKPVQVQITGTAPSLTVLSDEPVYDSVYVNFSASAAPLEKIGKSVTKGITLSPEIKGQWTWRNDSQLEFKPEQDWAVGEEYVVKFDKTIPPKYVDHLIRFGFDGTKNNEFESFIEWSDDLPKKEYDVYRCIEVNCNLINITYDQFYIDNIYVIVYYSIIYSPYYSSLLYYSVF